MGGGLTPQAFGFDRFPVVGQRRRNRIDGAPKRCGRGTMGTSIDLCAALGVFVGWNVPSIEGIMSVCPKARQSAVRRARAPA